jgi:hypothetical protein
MDGWMCRLSMKSAGRPPRELQRRRPVCTEQTDLLAARARSGGAGAAVHLPFSVDRLRDFISHFDLDSVRESHTTDAAALALSEKNLLCGFA